MIALGMRAARRNLGPVTWTYLASLLSAFPLALAAGALVHSVFGKSLEAETFATGLDLELMIELVTSRADALMLFAPLVLGAMLFWGALSAFLCGCVLMAVSSESPPATAEFFSGGGRVFGRLLRLVLFALPFGGLIVGLFGFGASKLVKWMSEDWVSEKGFIAVRVVAVLLVLLALAWVNAAYDLMKVEAVAKGEHRARYAFWRGLKRAARRPLPMLRVYLPFVLAAILLTLVVSLIDARIGRSSWLWVIVGGLIQQVTAYGRAALRVGLAGAEVAWVQQSRRSE